MVQTMHRFMVEGSVSKLYNFIDTEAEKKYILLVTFVTTHSTKSRIITNELTQLYTQRADMGQLVLFLLFFLVMAVITFSKNVHLIYGILNCKQ